MIPMAEDIDRSGLFNEIKQFSQRKLKKVETKVTSGSGEQLTEKRNAKGLQTIRSEGIKSPGYVVDHKPDLQVGMVFPGLFIGSQDVAQDKTTLDTFEITHILNLAYGVENAFEDDYNYKKVEILDTPETVISKYFDECFEFIDEGRQRGNCLVHCNAGVSRSSAICCAYLMNKEKMTFTDALNAVREARAFSKPNDGFMKQLQEYNDELRGSHGLKETNIDDAFTARQRAEIEAEKAALLSGNASVKNKLKQFGAQLDAHFAERAKFLSYSPIKLPLKKKTTQNDTNANNKMPPPPPLPPNVPPPPPPPMNQKNKPEPQRSRPEPIKPKEEPKKLIINKDMNNKIKDPNKSPSIDETPISVKAFRKNFELNNTKNMEIPKVQRTPATPKTNAMTNNPWNKPQTPATPTSKPEETKKKIIIKQRSKEAEEVPQRRSTRDLVDAIEKSKSPTPSTTPTQQLPYGQRRRQTTQLVDNNVDNQTNDISNQSVRQRMRGFESQNSVQSTPPPQSRTIKLMKQSSASPSPAASSPMSSNRNSPQPPVSHSPSPHPSDSESSKMVFGRVRPPRLSVTGRTLSQASQTLQDVSKAHNDSPSSSLTASASNSRSESPVSAVGHTRDTKSTSKSAHKDSPLSSESRAKAVPVAATTKPVSDSVANKWTSNASLDMKKNQSNKEKNSSSSEEELEDKTKQHKSTLSMQMKPNNNAINKNNEPQNDLSLTEPSSDNHYNSKKVPLGKTAGQQSFEKNKTGLNRSSSAAILKLIKSSTRTDIGLDRVEEDDEIEALLMELEKEGVDNVDWDALNVDANKVNDILENEKADESSDEESDDSDDEDSSDDSSDDEAVHMVINRQAPPEESDKSDFEVVDDEEEESD